MTKRFGTILYIKAFTGNINYIKNDGITVTHSMTYKYTTLIELYDACSTA